jgi:hypothetical protein
MIIFGDQILTELTNIGRIGKVIIGEILVC